VETKRKRSAVAGREKDVLARLAEFQSGLERGLLGKTDAGASAPRGDCDGDGDGDGDERSEKTARDGAVGVSKFVSQGLYYAEEADETDAGDWKLHALRFAEDAQRDPGAYAASADDYVVTDPLLEKGKGKFAKIEKEKKRNDAWAGASLT
jgi:peptidyl-prolyl cis-trans isomerase SDCCAG10